MSLGTDLGVYQGDLAPTDLITSGMLQMLTSGVLPCKADGQMKNQFYKGMCYILSLREADSLSPATIDLAIHSMKRVILHW